MWRNFVSEIVALTITIRCRREIHPLKNQYIHRKLPMYRLFMLLRPSLGRFATMDPRSKSVSKSKSIAIGHVATIGYDDDLDLDNE